MGTQWKRLTRNPDEEQQRELLSGRVAAVYCVKKGLANAVPVHDIGTFIGPLNRNGEIRFITHSGIIHSGTLQDICTRYRVWVYLLPPFDGV